MILTHYSLPGQVMSRANVSSTVLIGGAVVRGTHTVQGDGWPIMQGRCHLSTRARRRPPFSPCRGAHRMAFLAKPTLLLVLALLITSLQGPVRGQSRAEHPFDNDELAHCLEVNHRPCRPDETRRCETNYLNRPTITLAAGNWESSVLTAWVAQIILSEVLKFPVHLTGDGAGSIDFYEEGAWTMNKPRRYAFDALLNADRSPSGGCDANYLESLSVPEALKNEPACQVSAKYIYSSSAYTASAGVDIEK